MLPKVCILKAMVFPVTMFGCESWAIKAEHWRIDTFKLWCWRTLESTLDNKEIKPINPKVDQSSIFIGRTDAEAEASILWSPDEENWLIGKDPDAGKDWRQKEKGATEDEMAGWHHWLNGHEFEWTLGDSERHGSLACCSPWDHNKLDATEQLNKNKEILIKKCQKDSFRRSEFILYGRLFFLRCVQVQKAKRIESH